MSQSEVPTSERGGPLAPVAALVFNLIPIVGVALWGWSAFALIVLYWFENVVVGVRTLASMIATGVHRENPRSNSSPGLAAFFIFHYGLFCLVHGFFVIATFGAGTALNDLLIDYPNLWIGMTSVGLWQAISFGFFLARGEAKTASPKRLMTDLYPRIIVTHLTIIAGAFLLVESGQPFVGVIALAMLKAGFDVADALGIEIPAQPMSITIGFWTYTVNPEDDEP